MSHGRSKACASPIRFLIGGWLLAATVAVAGVTGVGENTVKYLHQIWQAEEGLPSPIVQTILQTRDGYLWVTTREGLARFDGVRFTIPFDVKQGTEALKDRQYFALTETKDGSLWTSAAKGLARFKDGKVNYYTPTNGLPCSYVLKVFQDRQGNIWIGGTNGLARFENEQFIHYSEKDGYIEDSVRDIFEDHAGTLWIGTARGLVQVKNGKVTQHTVQNSPEMLPNNAVQCIYETRGDVLWFGTGGGLASLNKDGVSKLYTIENNSGLAHNTVRAIYEDVFGTLWVGEYGFTQQLIDGKFVHVTITGEMAQDFGNMVPGYVNSMTGDHEGDIWIGTSSGLNRLRLQTFQTFSKAEGLRNIITTSVLESRNGDMWIGTWGGGLSQIHEGRIFNWNNQPGVKNSLSRDLILALCEDRNGALWIGTDTGGLNRLKNGNFTVYMADQYPGMVDNVIKVIYEDKKGTLWIGGPNGLSQYKDGKFKRMSRGPSDPENNGPVLTTIKTILEDKKGNLWIGSQEGLTRIQTNSSKTYNAQDGFPADMVNALYEDEQGALWIGTDKGGLVRFKNEQFIAYNKAMQGSFSRIIHILEDNSGNLWMSSRSGIFRLSKQELNDYASKTVTNITSVSYGKLDGMRRAQCNGVAQPAGWKTKDGRIWFPTLSGVVAVDVKNIEPNKIAPPVLIEKVLVDDKEIQRDQKAVIPPGKSHIEFQYTALSFQVPEKVIFRCQLEGADSAWQEVGAKRSMSFLNLPPGEYVFHITACNNEGIWNETGDSFAFTLGPHFYQTFSFYGVSAAAIALMGWLFYRLRVRRLRQTQEELEILVTDRTKSLQQEITERKTAESALLESQQMVLRQERLAAVGQLSAGVAHEFNNILTVIQGHTAFLLENPNLDRDSIQSLEHISDGVERTAKLTQQMLAFSRKQIMQQQVLDLNDVVNQVTKMLSRILGENIMLHCDYDSQLPTIRADAGMVEQIIMNLSVNARDAMPKGGQLKVQTKMTDVTLDAHSHADARAGQFVCLSVSDTGYGMDDTTINRIFEPFFTTKDIGKGTGLGLATVYGIVKQHQGWIEVSSKIGQGTTFKVYFPINGKASESSTEKFMLPRVRGGKEVILVVEDEPVLRELVREILEHQGYRILEAGTGAEAMAIWEKQGHKIDLLFTDIVMPEGMSGRELAERMQAIDPRLPVIYSSGYSQEMMDYSPKLGQGVAFLSKPYHPAQLAQVVRDCLDSARNRVGA